MDYPTDWLNSHVYMTSASIEIAGKCKHVHKAPKWIESNEKPSHLYYISEHLIFYK